MPHGLGLNFFSLVFIESVRISKLSEWFPDSNSRRYWEDAGCHGLGGFICGPSYHEQFGGWNPTIQNTECPGIAGTTGTTGEAWKPENLWIFSYSK